MAELEQSVSVSLPELPNSVLTTVLERLGNLGSAVRLSVCCKKLHAAVINSDGFWAARSHELGWSAPQTELRESHSPIETLAWHQFVQARMGLRARLRRLLSLYIAFLGRPSQMALQRGATPAELSAAEARLGLPLPWELWELYRWASGRERLGSRGRGGVARLGCRQRAAARPSSRQLAWPALARL